MKAGLRCLLFMAILSGYRTVAQQVSVAQVKQLRQNAFIASDSLFRPYTLEGYFFKDPLPLLITNPKWARVNTKMPDSVYIVLNSGELKSDAVKFQGAYIRITGVINSPLDTLTGSEFFNNRLIRYDVDFNLTVPPELLTAPSGIAPNPSFVNTCVLQPLLCAPNLVGNNNNYALLYSGGIDKANAHARYWNDMTFMYQTLKSKYGYTDEHIIVVYKDGLAESVGMPVDYRATEKGLDSAFSELARELTGDNNLFIFMSNHGGGYDKKGKRNYDGVSDQRPADETDKYKIDEVSFFYEENYNTILDDDFSQKVNNLKFNNLIALFGQCYSGGFLRDLRGTGRIIMSAAMEFEPSWGDDALQYDYFSYYFTAAINGSTPDNVPAPADTNNDGRISMLEAFNYATRNDPAKETPLLEDTGDGKGAKKPKARQGRDGWLASSSFLN